MKIIIAGAGEVGTHLAEMLTRQDHSITVIDEDGEHLRKMEQDNDLLTIEGSPTSIKNLKDAGVEDTDLFIAVTPHESQNITACLLATNLGAKKKVARVDNGEYLEENCQKFFSKMGIDAFIYPEKLAAEEIMTSLNRSWVRQWLEFGDGALILIGMKVRGGAPILNKRLQDLTNSDHYRIVAIRRDLQTIVPRGSDEVLEGDIVYFITTHNFVDHVRKEAGKEVIQVRDLIIMGASKITEQLCGMLPKSMQAKVLEKDKVQADKLSRNINQLVVNSDATDPNMLQEEDIEDMDAFVAMSSKTESNILACLEAKRHGIKKTIAEVENMSYIPLAEQLDIGYIVNKKLIAASYIYQYTLDANVSVNRVKCLTHVDVEVLELIAKVDTKITSAPIYQLDLPKDIFIGGVIKPNGVGFIANGKTLIEAGDRVVVFCRSASIKNISAHFRQRN
ncbi:MAG: Trk system potassium transporter TrkA [Paludibacteraceae bacterium]|nr:Trk system potassium transporter TrkA [Paludibacteraceae bacterium]